MGDTPISTSRKLPRESPADRKGLHRCQASSFQKATGKYFHQSYDSCQVTGWTIWRHTSISRKKNLFVSIREKNSNPKTYSATFTEILNIPAGPIPGSNNPPQPDSVLLFIKAAPAWHSSQHLGSLRKVHPTFQAGRWKTTDRLSHLLKDETGLTWSFVTSLRMHLWPTIRFHSC